MEPLPRGDARDRRAFVAETRFSGFIVSCPWSRDDVARILPPTLRLAAAPGVARDQHPVVFVFGEHDRSAVLFASLALSTGVRFRELLIAVPYVREAQGTRRALFVPRVFSGEPVVTWSGNAHYGFAKQMVPMEWLGDTFVVSGDDGGLLTHATVQATAPWQQAPGTRPPALVAAAALARLPFLGHRRDGSLVWSHSAWDFAEAWIRPVRASISIDAPLGRGLAPTLCHGAPLGGLEVAGMRWRLSWPEAGVSSARAPNRAAPR
jgi:hypothetical protein